MRIQMELDDEWVAELDRQAGSRGRSAYAAELVKRGLEDERRWYDIEAGLCSLPDSGHEWDDDPATWVRRQRRVDERYSG